VPGHHCAIAGRGLNAHRSVEKPAGAVAYGMRMTAAAAVSTWFAPAAWLAETLPAENIQAAIYVAGLNPWNHQCSKANTFLSTVP
jgi:hypothetical protein